MNKSIRILSPITLSVILLLDAAVIAYGVFAIKRLLTNPSAGAIFFAAVEVLALIISILTTKEAVSSCAVFREDELEFTGIDGLNVFSYEDIKGVEIYRDTSASLSKNFIDRHALLIITLSDGRTVTIDIGLATKGTVDKIAKELARHVGEEAITFLNAKKAKNAKERKRKRK
ncbi:MAG: hypothetical protein LUH82_02035 [Clostridiales bacterium]|nr:hypothetical protein [Clostridiales bacterium]